MVRVPRSREHVWPLAGVGVGLLLAAGTAPAQQPPTETFFETATVRARPLSTATAAVTVLDREAIEALGVISVAELIRFIPGLDVTTTGPRGGIATAQIRGGDPNFTTVLLDGVALNDLTDQFGGAFDLASLSVEHVERVEVVRGPLSSTYGPTGLAGAIHIITRRGAAGESAIDFAAGAGSDSVRQAALSWRGAGERREHFVGATWEQEENRVVRDRFRGADLHGNARVRVGGAGAVRVTGRLAARDTLDYPDASGGPVFGTGETRDSDHEESSLALEWTGGRPDRQQRAHLAFQHHALERRTPAVPNPVDPFGSLPAAVEHTRFTSWRAGWIYPLLARARLRVDAGVEVAHERGDVDSRLELPPPLDDGSFELERSVAGALVEALSEHGPWLVELGARVDAPQGFDTEWSARAGLGRRLAEGSTRVRGSVGRAFKLPSFFSLGNPLVGNPDLEPERVVSADAGIEHRLDPLDLDAALTLFTSDFDDLIDFDFETLRTVNRSSVRTEGAELALAWTPGTRASVHASLTAQDVDVRGGGGPLRQRPDRIGGARFTWRGGRLRWELDGQWVSERFDQQIPVPDRRRVAGYVLYGASVSFDAFAHWQLRARVDNLADEDHETFIGFPGPDRAVRVTLYRHAEPRRDR
jgi:outer membrane cobalamin receptor